MGSVAEVEGLISVARGKALRALCAGSGRHFEGLAAAARASFPGPCRKNQALRKKLVKLDVAYQVARHISEPSIGELIEQVQDRLHCRGLQGGWAAGVPPVGCMASVGFGSQAEGAVVIATPSAAQGQPPCEGDAAAGISTEVVSLDLTARANAAANKDAGLGGVVEFPVGRGLGLQQVLWVDLAAGDGYSDGSAVGDGRNAREAGVGMCGLAGSGQGRCGHGSSLTPMVGHHDSSVGGTQAHADVSAYGGQGVFFPGAVDA